MDEQIKSLLGLASQAQRESRLEQAERLCGQALQIDPNQADAWNRLGMVHFQMQRLSAAIDNLQRAAELQPNQVVFHVNLGEICRATGQLSQYEVSYRRAIEIDPSNYTAMIGLGVVLTRLKQPAAGLEYFDRAIELSPQSAEAHRYRGLALIDLRRFNDSIGSLADAIRLQPENAVAYVSLGTAYRELGHSTEAIGYLEEALRRGGPSAEVYIEQGRAWLQAGAIHRGVDAFRRAIDFKPSLPEAHNALGIAFRNQSNISEAVACYRRALAIRPNYVEALTNLGNALKDQGQLAAAVEHYTAALAIEPNHTEAHIGRATIRLVTGDFAQGWPEFEWRWNRPALASSINRGRPLWDGSSLTGRTILLTAEHGLGDTLHFVRYASCVKQCGGRVVLECQSPLVRLIARTAGIDAIVTREESPATWDLQAPLGSLPRIFGTTLDTIPSTVPYVFAGPELTSRWREELEDLLPGPGLTIGLAWRGNPLHPGDRFRSFALSWLNTLRAQNVRLYSLQKDTTEEERRILTDELGAIDLGPRLDDMDVTAAVVTNLDLVIACDSSVAHLAGALGRNVWVALPSTPDWRWLLERDDSPWYPTMRLFRQSTLGDWTDVFARLAAVLEGLR